eukprot:TRINITY_DN8076_c0_g1_i1.p1 TRINITY_DN8076_c0_g1~~TRINITY_DN8076_c0_g1_i1.p1  ORF type:complete len:1840 (+),score=660.19 TRINITY_DN8076_c0_g1_i1:1160-6679(+)
MAGPTDTEWLFDKFVAAVNGRNYQDPRTPTEESKLKEEEFQVENAKITKVLILGSGGLSIGQAGEFDYSGSQAIKALKEEDIFTVLINPNIATVQTTPGLADRVYFLPVTPEFVIRVMELEKPDGILVTFGGQTALNCGVKLYKAGVFERMGVRVLGTPIEAIIATEDREIFAQKMEEISEKIAPSLAARSLEEAIDVAESIKYPVILRAAFALGGLGSGFAHNREELTKLATAAFANSEQVLIEKSLKGWKEVEYEVVRDYKDNCITVTNMENFDPLGIHTGESIVIAPSQTLTDKEVFMLRNTAIKVIRHLGIVGECNIQYALDPHSEDYCIIEVNARLSRSSALASKATGYPLAFIAAKLALGKDLPTLRNSVTKVSTACFEPALDYVVIKMPIWDLRKFERVETQIGTSMKSVGEVMSIGRTFEEAIQKAIRCVNNQADGFQADIVPFSEPDLEFPTDQRIYVLASAFKKGMSVERAHELTRIDRWFLEKLKSITDMELQLEKISSENISSTFMLNLKQRGFSDRQIARCTNSTESVVRTLRKNFGILPVVKQIDTVAAEVVAQNNYLYMTYNGSESDIVLEEKGYMVIGSGGYRIGSSVEFDWCAVGAITTLAKLGLKSIMVNYNPETVSTDYDICDRLYFEELSVERVLDIYELEASSGVIVSMGGQIPNNLCMSLWRKNVKILGTSPDMIDTAENRYKFSRLLDSLGVDQPRWKELTSKSDVAEFCDQVGYPVLIRPSYVLSGAAMNVVYTQKELDAFLDEATQISRDHPVVISKFVEYAKEIEMDAVARNGHLVMHCISEHVENAGVHSGDATLVFPAQDLDELTTRAVEDATKKIAKALNITGPVNIQFLAKDDHIQVIECNLRASRSFPLISKTLKYNLIEMATRVIMNAEIDEYPVVPQNLPYVGVKVAQFSFSRLLGADPILRVEMASTGEVAGFGKTRYEAFMKALLSTGFRLPEKNIFVSIGAFKEKMEFLNSAKDLVAMGYKLFGSPGTADFLATYDIPIVSLRGREENSSEMEEHIAKHIHLCIICPGASRGRPSSFLSRGYITRRKALDSNVPLITNIKYAKMFIHALGLYTQAKKIVPIGDPDIRDSRRIVVLPGLIDTHVHVREPGQEYKEDWDTCTAAALAGGITMIGAMPNTKPPIIDSESFLLVSKLAAAKARCDYGIYLGGSSLNLKTASSLAQGSIAMKMYLDQTFTTLQLTEMSYWMEHFKNWPKDVPICCHSEGANLAAVILLAHINDRSVHLCHVSRKDEIELIRSAKAKGIKVTCEVTPHHLFLTEEDMQELGSGRSQVRPRLTPVDRQALWDNMDVIDCFATDHAPHTEQEKDSENPPPGFPGLETSLVLFLTAVKQGLLTIDDIILRMHTNPKRIFNLPDQPNTFVEVDLDHEWTIPKRLPFCKSKWTPFAGKTVFGRVSRVVLRGEIAYLDGKVFAKPGTGRDVRNLVAFASAPTSSVTLPAASPFASTSTDQLLMSPSAPMPLSRAKKSSGSFHSESPPEIIKHRVDRSMSIGFNSADRTFFGKSILSVKQFSRDDLHLIFNQAQDMKGLVRRFGSTDLLKGRILANLFYEPSTRTSVSFAAAMVRLGGSVISVDETKSSVAKGESLSDTIKTLESYTDAVVIRHPEKGSAQLAASSAKHPIINAGDGVGEHPTQALLDVFTIREELGTVNNLEIGIVGDLKHGRTVHSLVQLLSLYKNIRLHYISPSGLGMPSDVRDLVHQKGVPQTDHTDLESVIGRLDVLYVTRIQKERFENASDYDAVKDHFSLTVKMMSHAKQKMIVMHPLPRVNEIHPDVDSDPRAAYIRQMENGMYVRMALLSLVIPPTQ